MSQVLIVFGPDDECIDPEDALAAPRRHVEVIDDDVIVIHRQYDDRFEGGVRTLIFSKGIWEAIDTPALRAMLEVIDSDT
jgi:hypothetical protein